MVYVRVRSYPLQNMVNSNKPRVDNIANKKVDKPVNKFVHNWVNHRPNGWVFYVAVRTVVRTYHEILQRTKVNQTWCTTAKVTWCEVNHHAYFITDHVASLVFINQFWVKPIEPTVWNIWTFQVYAEL